MSMIDYDAQHIHRLDLDSAARILADEIVAALDHGTLELPDSWAGGMIRTCADNYAAAKAVVKADKAAAE